MNFTVHAPREGTIYSQLSVLLARQEVRYLLAGSWNTVFGLGCSYFLYWLLHRYFHYMLILVFTNILAVSMAYMTHKMFVFRTKGNVVREYIKFYFVYGACFLFGLATLPVCIELLGLDFYISQ